MVILNSLIKFCFIADVREVIKCGVDGNGGESGKLAQVRLPIKCSLCAKKVLYELQRYSH